MCVHTASPIGRLLPLAVVGTRSTVLGALLRLIIMLSLRSMGSMRQSMKDPMNHAPPPSLLDAAVIFFGCTGRGRLWFDCTHSMGEIDRL